MQTTIHSIDFLAPVMSNEPMDPAAQAVYDLLLAIGEDPSREGLRDTPQRVARMYSELLAGERTDPKALINSAIFDADYHDMVLVTDIEFASLCEHHLLPFIGRAHVAYLPDGKVLGLSKIPRIVDMFARRLQLQERMTGQIADFLEEVIQPRGVAVVVEASHMCAAIRGVKKPASRMTTSIMRGAYHTDTALREEFWAHLSRAKMQADAE
jgi:GTP cyclohydrolase IA